MSLNLTYDDIGRRYSFQVYPDQIIGTDFTAVEYLGSIDATGVSEFEPRNMHALIYPTLPSGSVDRFNGYAYHRFRLADGKVAFVGDIWIKENTFVVINNTEYHITIRGKSPGIENAIRDMLQRNNYTDFDIDIVNK